MSSIFSLATSSLARGLLFNVAMGTDVAQAGVNGFIRECCLCRMLEKLGTIMAEEPNTEKAEKPVPIEKLLIDNSSNFQFHAAYVAYSDSFDKASNDEIKKKLNESILALQKGDIDYQEFYRNISQYRPEEGFQQQRGYGRAFIKTQRKRDWRRQSQKHERLERHKK
jgi:hypothetical protein